MPGVIAVLTGEDVAAAGQKPMPAAAPMKGRDGAEQRATPRFSLARDQRALRRRARRPGRRRDGGAGAGRGRGGGRRIPRPAGGGHGARRRSPPGASQLHADGARQPGARLHGRRRGGDQRRLRARGARGEALPRTTRAWSATRWSRAPRWAPTIPPADMLLPARHHAGRGTDARAAARRCSAWRRTRSAWSPRKWAAASACASTPIPEYGALLLRGEEARPPGEVGRQPLGSVPRRRAGARHRAHAAKWRSTPRAASSACASTTSPTWAPTSPSPAPSSTP